MSSLFGFEDGGPAIETDFLPLAARLDSVRLARRFIRSRLPDWGLEALVDDCMLVASELVTNAITHGGGHLSSGLEETSSDLVTVRLRLTASHLFTEIEDGSAQVPRARNAGEADEDGRGLYLVGRHACHWDWQLTPHGKCVWACWALRGKELRTTKAKE